jgi:single-strand DNA-binding protein
MWTLRFSKRRKTVSTASTLSPPLEPHSLQGSRDRGAAAHRLEAPGETEPKGLGKMNRISLRGRAGSDPTVRTTNSGAQVASFRLATEESWKVDGDWKKRTTWHTIETFRPADVKTIEDVVVKGALVRVDGTLRIEEYTDKDNVKRQSAKVVTTEFDHGVYYDPRGVKEDSQASREEHAD